MKHARVLCIWFVRLFLYESITYVYVIIVIYRHMEAIVHQCNDCCIVHMCMIDSIIDWTCWYISNLFKCSLVYFRCDDVDVPLYFFFISHPLSHLHIIVHLSFVPVVCVCVCHWLFLLFTTFVYMSYATTPTKGSSTVDCEVLTGKFL